MAAREFYDVNTRSSISWSFHVILKFKGKYQGEQGEEILLRRMKVGAILTTLEAEISRLDAVTFSQWHDVFFLEEVFHSCDPLFSIPNNQYLKSA